MILPSISVVVPVYNSEETLPELVRALEPVLKAQAVEFELILVNDASQDRSWDAVQQLVQDHEWIQGINLMRNYGQHNALLCGIRLAQGEVCITMDDDLQHPPIEIPRLLAKLAEGYDVVYGTPEQEQHRLWRDLASLITKIALQSAMGVDVARRVSAFRALRTQVRDGFADYHGPFVSLDVLLTWGTTRFASIPVRHDPRQVGRSNYTFLKLVGHALNMITGFSVLPLQVSSMLGFIATIFGLLVLFYVIGRYLILGYSVPGFPFLASIITIYSGIQLFALGIIGEYLARMHFRTMDRPTYTIRSIVSHRQVERHERDQVL